MKEHFQDYGVRRWAGDDLIELQGEPLEALQRLVEPYAPCIIQGCGINTAEKRIEPGLVALWLLDGEKKRQCVKIARFGGCPTTNLPVYLTLKCSQETRVYADGESKVVANSYAAQESILWEEVKDMYPLTITETGGTRLPENISVNFAPATEREHIESGERLPILFGKIRKWLKDLGALAFKSQVAESDFDADLTTAFDNKVDNTEDGLNGAINLLKESSTTPKDNDFYISQYVDGGTNNKTYWRRKMYALWAYIKGKLSSDTGVNISGNAATATKATQDSDGNVIKTAYAKKTSIPTGVWRSNNSGKNSSSATTTLTAKQACTFTLKWLVSSESNFDKLTLTAAGTTLVNAVSGEKSGTVAETSLAAGAAIALAYSKDGSNNSGRDLAEISGFYITVNGVLVAITPFNIDTYFTVTHGTYFFSPVFNISVATADLPGLMSAADKAKLAGIAAGANAYTHPTSGTGAKTSGLYKIATDANGHVTGAAAVAKSDITALGIPDKNTTYSVATASADGLMSAADKTKLNKYPTIDPSTMVIKDIYYTLKRTPNSSSFSLAVQPEASTSGAGLMSAADKRNLDMVSKFKIVGFYTSASESAIYQQWGYSITGYYDTFNGEKCVRFTLPISSGFSASKMYMCIAIGGYKHTADVYYAFLKGGETNYLFHRPVGGGAPEYAGFPARMFIIEI